MKRKGCLIALGIVAALVGWAVIYTWPETHRYRMTVEVDTPQGLRTGSSVIETKSRREIKILPDQHTRSSSMKGEAVAVDLPGGQTLFALLRGEGNRDFGDLNRDALGDPGSEARKLGAGPAPIPRKIVNWNATETSGLPLLVRFRNIRDPASVERINSDNLALSFGEGITLRRITLQATDDPATRGIKKRLPWLADSPEPSLNPKHGVTDRSLSATIYNGDFMRNNGN